MYDHERIGGNLRTISAILSFCRALTDYFLSDLGFIEPLFTWNNKKEENNKIQECLDRAAAISIRRNLFPSFSVEHLDFNMSNDRPLLISLENLRVPDPRKKKVVSH